MVDMVDLRHACKIVIPPSRSSDSSRASIHSSLIIGLVRFHLEVVTTSLFSLTQAPRVRRVGDSIKSV